MKSDWDGRNTLSLAGQPIVRLIPDGTVIPLLVVLARAPMADGQKVLLAIKSMGGVSAEAWRTVLVI